MKIRIGIFLEHVLCSNKDMDQRAYSISLKNCISTKSHLKKYAHWYWLAWYLVFFVCLPVLIAFVAGLNGYYIRIVLNLILWLTVFGFSVYVIFVPEETYFRRKPKDSKYSKTKAGVILFMRVFYILALGFSVYSLVPDLNGIFQITVLHKSYEKIDDSVVYAYSSEGKYLRYQGDCRYRFCQIKLQNEPNRELEYDYAPDIQEGKRYEFILLPGSNLVVGSQGL